MPNQGRGRPQSKPGHPSAAKGGGEHFSTKAGLAPDPVPVNLPTVEEIEALTPRALLRKIGLSARRVFSQNFLTDQYVVSAAIEASGVGADDEALEIGPGLGVLTRELLKVAQRVVAVELDRGFAELLPRLVRFPEKLKVIQASVLDFDPKGEMKQGYRVVANLPYHITSPVLRKFLTAEEKPRTMVVMVQKEVAERIMAKAGDTSVLSVMVQLYSSPSIVAQVPASSFYPAPKVDSTVIKLDVNQTLPVQVDDPESLIQLVSAGFSRRRKQIHNSLSESTWFPSGGVFEVLESAGIDPKRRAETLTLEEWAELYRVYGKAKEGWQESGEQ